MTTIGHVVSVLFEKHERRFRDEKLAAVATQVELGEVLRKQHVGKRKGW
jgi:hypothetical protein